MFRFRQRFVGAWVLALALPAAHGAWAQSGPNGGAAPTPIPTGQPARVQLTEETLPSMLQQLGYQVTTKQHPDGSRYWQVAVERDGWKFVAQVMLQKPQGLLISSAVGKKVPASISLQSFAKILEWSGKTDYFTYNRDTGTLCMNCRYPYKDASLEELRQEFNGFFQSIRESYDVWNNLGAGGNPLPPIPDPVVIPVLKNIAGTIWSGEETGLPGFGKLTFQFHADGKATMIDAHSTVNGSWSQNGAEVTIRFGDCVYSGRIAGQQMAGTARSDSSESWSFRVALQ